MSNDTFRREMLSPVGSTTETSGPVAMVLGDRYELKREIGKGGMGQVHRARDRKLDRTVAVKVITAAFSGVPEFRARFVREGQLNSKIEHPNVVRVYDCGDDAGRLYLVMELLEGRRLDHVVTERSGFRVEEAIRIFADVLLGLHAIHAKDAVHRDLKSGNVMLVGPNLEAKILDFGLVKHMKKSGDAGSDPTLTQVNGVLGTPNYMSPEQCRGEELDHRSDIYSAGILLYEMIAGRPPFSIPGRRQDPASIISRQLRDPPPPFYLTLAGTLVPPDVEAVVRKALEKKPSDRFSSTLEMREALLKARLREEEYRVPPPAPKRTWLLPVAAAVLACVALAAVGIFWGKGSGGNDAAVVEAPAATSSPIPAAVPPEERPPAPGSAAEVPPAPVVAPPVVKTEAAPPPIAKAPPPRPAAAATTDQGCALFDSYESAKAVEVLTTVVRSSPNDRRAWYCLCGSYSRIPGVQSDEVATCEKANALNRNNRGERVLTARWLEQAKKGN